MGLAYFGAETNRRADVSTAVSFLLGMAIPSIVLPVYKFRESDI